MFLPGQQNLFRKPDDETGSAPPADAADAAEQGPDLSFIPSDYRDGDNIDTAKFGQHYLDSIAALSQHEERLQGVPDAYEFAMPEELDLSDIPLPKDYDHGLKADDPAFEQLGAWLKENNVPQAAVPGLMGLVAKWRAAEYSKTWAPIHEEYTQIANAEQRIQRVEKLLGNRVDGDEAKGLMMAVGTAAGLRALEKLLGNNQHTAPTTRVPQNSVQVTGTARQRHAQLVEMQERNRAN